MFDNEGATTATCEAMAAIENARGDIHGAQTLLAGAMEGGGVNYYAIASLLSHAHDLTEAALSTLGGGFDD